jgi:hypothetical protein
MKNGRRLSLENKIKDLKNFFLGNTADILRTERELNQIVSDDMREEVLRMRNFEQLNNEKITPHFLSLAKKPHSSDSLVDICKENGEPFEDPNERDTYIRNYYAETYKKIPKMETIIL